MPTKTQVSGTVTDPNGVPYSGAQLSIVLQPASGISASVAGAQIQGILGPIRLDSNGAFSESLWGNDQISPAGTQWQFNISTPGIAPPQGTGPQAFSVLISISGATQDVSATLSGAAPALASAGTGAVKAASAVLTNQSTLVPLVVNTETEIVESDPVNIPAGTHKVIVIGQTFVAPDAAATECGVKIHRGSGIAGALVSEQSETMVAGGNDLSRTVLGIDSLVGPIVGQKYTLSGQMLGAAGNSQCIFYSIAVLVL